MLPLFYLNLMAKKDLTPREKAFKEKYKDDKNRIVSTRDVENIRRFYEENFTEEERKNINLHYEISKMDRQTIKQTSNQGANLFITDPIMYVGYSDNTTTQISYKQKLSAAKKMNTKLIFDGVEVSYPKFIDLIEDEIEKSRIEHLIENETYYKTYIFLQDDIDNNLLIYDSEKYPPQSY